MSEREPPVRQWASSVSSQVTSVRIDPATPWAWIVSLLPTLPFLAIGAIAASIHAPVPVSVLVAMIVVSHLVSAGAAWFDADRLMNRGASEVASPLWALLLPAIYLWRRAKPYRDQLLGTEPFWLDVLIMPPCILGAFFFGSLAVTLGNQ
jgi:hypothetical protein